MTATGFEVFRQPAVVAVLVMIFGLMLAWIFVQCDRAVRMQHRREDK